MQQIDFSLRNPKYWLNSLLRTAQISEHAKEDFYNQYICDRTYHGLFHPAFLWHCHIILSSIWIKEHHDAEAIHQRMANAITCHDIQMATDGSSEQQSATWWLMNHSVVLQEDIDWTYEAILASKNHLLNRPMETENDLLTQWFLGIDLLPLAAPQPIFDMNGHMLRAEFSHLSCEAWDTGRKAFLANILKYQLIYRHPALHSFESAARENINRVLSE